MAKSIMFGTKLILQVSSINIYGWSCNASVSSNIIKFKKVKLSFGHPVYRFPFPILRFLP